MPSSISGVSVRWLGGIARAPFVRYRGESWVARMKPRNNAVPGSMKSLFPTPLSPARFRGLSPRHSQAGGFSLVEVVIAIGIVAFAFVGILGLIPVGMATFSQAMDISVCSQIVDRVINEAKQTEFDTLVGPALADRTFDREGDETLDPKFVIYDVRVSVNKSTALPNTSTPESDNLATVVIQIAQNPGRKAAPFDPLQKVPVTTYAALIARNQTRVP